VRRINLRRLKTMRTIRAVVEPEASGTRRSARGCHAAGSDRFDLADESRHVRGRAIHGLADAECVERKRPADSVERNGEFDESVRAAPSRRSTSTQQVRRRARQSSRHVTTA